MRAANALRLAENFALRTILEQTSHDHYHKSGHGRANSILHFTLEMKDRGIKRGKYAFSVPVALILVLSSSRIVSQIAIPHGLMIMQPLTGLFSAI